MLQSKRRQDALIVSLEGEIDDCCAQQLRQELEELLCDPAIRHLILDFSAVSFMDSSGIGMIIGRYRTMKARGGRVSAVGLHPPVDRLFHMAGLHRIIGLEPEERQDNA